ncbi:hypothetical protein CVT26_007727 [Gymnopilus dilepis]|uniref:Uncharacterized protein n=1 Tax=Gymnopilus dilepis TaxID=231916 RepID=A0A409VZZ6_9AGAR|nr:hypothetical protein CVT26_007727 [Gymnopilus dilepis]
MNFRLFCLTALASLLATTQAELLINSPAPNSLVEHEGTIQVVVPFASTQAMKQSQEILLVIGLVPCCQDPSSNLGETIFTGTYTPQGFIDGNPLTTYQNFTLIVPPNLGGGVGIQVMRVALGDSPPLLVPDVDFASVQVNAFA